jgi:CRP-like cAMP-binding protein
MRKITECLRFENFLHHCQTHIRYQDLKPDEILFHQGDPVSAIYWVELGRVRLDRCTSEGKVYTFQVSRPGDSLAFSTLFDNFYEWLAISEVASRVIVCPKEVLLEHLAQQSCLTQTTVQQLGLEINSFRKQLELRELRNAEYRIMHYLRAIAASSGNTIQLDRPLKLIAADLGLSPESLYRALIRLENQGAIRRIKQSIVLLKQE